LHNPDHDWFSGDRQEALGGDPLLQVYQEIDASVGRLLASVKRDATVLIHLSHGMTDHNDGTHLLDEVLKRLERGSPKPTALDPLQKFFQRSTPTLRRFASAWRVPGSLRQFIAQAMRAELPAGRARRRYYLTPNNFVCSGIRLNLIGREPQGKVRSDEVDEVCRSLERDLLELINVATGKPAIRAVVRSDAYHRRRPQDTIPDLFVDWDRSAAIEEVASAKVGTVRRPYTGWRSGDHRPEGLLIVTGPDIPRGTTAPPLAVEDIGPSIASRLGVQLQGVDGEVVHWLAGCAMSAGPGTAARHS
jgi:predicted AlkP superfamily phosphohydrolase/phosphomutase